MWIIRVANRETRVGIASIICVAWLGGWCRGNLWGSIYMLVCRVDYNFTTYDINRTLNYYVFRNIIYNGEFCSRCSEAYQDCGLW